MQGNLPTMRCEVDQVLGADGEIQLTPRDSPCENPEISNSRSLCIFFIFFSPENYMWITWVDFSHSQLSPSPISPTSRGAKPNRPHRSCKHLWKRSPGPFPIPWFPSAAPRCCAWTCNQRGRDVNFTNFSIIQHQHPKYDQTL